MASNETRAGRAAKAATGSTAKSAGATAGAAAHAAGNGADSSDAAFAYPRFEVPEMFRSLSEQGMAQTREAYARLKTAAEEATGMFEDSFGATRDSVRDVQVKGLDIAKANADATFDLVRKLMTVTSVADAMELQTAYARERMEALVDYSKDLQGAMSTLGAEAGKPAKALFEHALKQNRAA